jgi:hypothetical protein
MKHSPKTARVIPGGHHDDRAKPLLITPASKYGAFTFSSGYIPRNLVDVLNSQRSESSNRPGGAIFIWGSATDELALYFIRGVSEDTNSRGHSVVNEIGSFKFSSSIGLARNDNNVSGPDVLVDNERRSGGAQNRVPNGRHTNAGNGQEHACQRNSTTQVTSNHRLDNT